MISSILLAELRSAAGVTVSEVAAAGGDSLMRTPSETEARRRVPQAEERAYVRAVREALRARMTAVDRMIRLYDLLGTQGVRREAQR